MNKLHVRVKRVFKNEYFILSILLVLGLFVRLYKINNPVADWHSWRQADTAAVSRNFVEDRINLFLPKYDDVSSIQSGIDNPQGLRMVEFPVYNAIHAIFYITFPQFSLEVWGRLTTAIISLITAIFLYLLVRKNYNKNIAFLTSFFFLFLPFNIYFSRAILPDQLGVLFAILGLYFFDIKLLISAIFYALMLLQKPYLAIYLLPLIPKLISKENRKKNLFFLISVFIPFLLWRVWEGIHPEGIPFYKWAFNGDKIRFHPAYFRWIFGERIGILILGVGGVTPYILGLLEKTKSKLGTYLNLSALIYLVVVATANVRHDYYQILIIPAIALSLAIGSVVLWKRSKILLILSTLVMFLVSWDRIKPFYAINHPELMEVGQIVDQTLPKDALIVAPYNGDTAFLYQTNRWGWPAIDDSIDNIIERGADYYVSVDPTSTDSINFEKRFQTITKTDKYIILDLHKEIKQ